MPCCSTFQIYNFLILSFRWTSVNLVLKLKCLCLTLQFAREDLKVWWISSFRLTHLFFFNHLFCLSLFKFTAGYHSICQVSLTFTAHHRLCKNQNLYPQHAFSLKTCLVQTFSSVKIQKTFHKVSLQVCKHKKHSVSRNYTFGNTNSTIFSVFEGRVGWMVGESLYSYSLSKF